MRLGDADRIGHLLERFSFGEAETGETCAEAHGSGSGGRVGLFDKSDDNMQRRLTAMRFYGLTTWGGRVELSLEPCLMSARILEILPIDQLRPWPRNARAHSRKQIR